MGNQQQHAKLCTLNATLEKKIQARIGDLERANRTLARDIGDSQRDQLESVEALRQSTQLLDNIVDNIPTAVQLKSVHDGFRIVMWNKAAEKAWVPGADASSPLSLSSADRSWSLPVTVGQSR